MMLTIQPTSVGSLSAASFSWWKTKAHMIERPGIGIVKFVFPFPHRLKPVADEVSAEADRESALVA